MAYFLVLVVKQSFGNAMFEPSVLKETFEIGPF
jgi:hypothetical protein